MLEGWYCRSMANQQANENDEDSDDSQEDVQPDNNARAMDSGSVDYKARYLLLKRKLKFLLYENEYFQDTLRFNQRRLLKISRDRAFLLDRLLQYEKPGTTSSEGDATDSSDDDTPQALPPTQKETIRKRKLEGKAGTSSASVTGGSTRGRKRKIPLNQGGHVQTIMQKQKKLQVQQQQPPQNQPHFGHSESLSFNEQENRDIQMTTAEITRQLQDRKPSAMDLMSVECTPSTVPATMLSDESPSKCFQIDQPQHLTAYLDNESPSHVAAEECVEYIN